MQMPTISIVHCKNFVFIILFLNTIGAVSDISAQVKKDNETFLFDSHVHLNKGEKSYLEYMSQLKESQRDFTKIGAIVMAKKGDIRKIKMNNDSLIELAGKYQTIIPICSVHPLDGQLAIDELKRLAKLGIKVIKLHPLSQDFEVDNPLVLNLCKFAGELNIKILLDNAGIKAADSQKLFDLALKCPDTDFIFAHMGGMNFRFWNLLPLVKTAKGYYCDNIYFDISATTVLVADSPLEEEFVWTIRNIGVDRILFGSDFPQFTLKQALYALDCLDLNPEEKAIIRYKNAMRLFSIK